MAVVFVLFFGIIVMVLGIWLLPFLLLTATCVGAIALSSSLFFRIFGPPEIPKSLLLVLTLAAGSLSASAQALTPPTDEARKKDIYAVYSVAIPGTQVPPGNEIYLIEEKTGTRLGRLTNSSPCVVPPTHQQSWDEAVADFSARGATSITLDRSFNLRKPYQLLTEADLSAFRATTVTFLGQVAIPDARFQGAKASYSVSDVFFNRNRTLGLVFVTHYCGGLCGRGEWKVFERPVDGEWREAPVRCLLSWIA